MRRHALLLLLACGCGPDAPVADFQASPVSGAAPLRVRFEDRSEGGLTRTWDFGDGCTSDLAAPFHVYHRSGTYDVSLTVRGADGASVRRTPGLVGVEGSAPRHNVLLVVADDLSVADVECYGVNPNLRSGLTPTIDSLAARGVLFETAWTNPLCSPSRAAILTGRYAFRTGIGSAIESAPVGLRAEELTLCEALETCADAGYAHAAFGKWHLEPIETSRACAVTELHGFDRYDGNLWQVNNPCSWLHAMCPPAPGLSSSMSFETGGDAITRCEEYMTEYLLEQARAWTAAQQGPWFCWFAPQMPYEKLHVPPARLQDVVQGEPCEPCARGARDCYDAALKALDTALGELLASFGPRWEEELTVVFVGDNGTPNNALNYWPKGEGKGSLSEGGVHVPLIIAGRAVAPARRGARAPELVCSTDIWRTVAAAVGATDLPPTAGQDSLDLAPLLASPPGPGGRDFLFTESFRRNAVAGPYEEHRAAVRDQRFKLVWDVAAGTPTGLWDLAADPLEQQNLLEGGRPAPDTEAGAALDRLEQAVREVLGS